MVKDESEADEIDEEELAEMYDQGGNDSSQDDSDINQVKRIHNCSNANHRISRNKYGTGEHIQLVASQILTIFLDKQNQIPFHIELDSGATVS